MVVPPGNSKTYGSYFIRDFIDINIGMWTTNNALTPDLDKEPAPLTSMPYHWPFMLRTLRMCGWGDNEIKFFLVGNPTIWWSSTASLVLLTLSFIIYSIRRQRGISDFKTWGIICITVGEWEDFYFAFKISVIGWFLHYFAFYIMGRVM